MTRCIRFLAVAATLAAASTASAQNYRPAIDSQRLRLDPTAHGSLVLGDGEVLEEGQFRAALTGHYERSPMVLTTSGDLRGYGVGADSTKETLLLRERATVHLNLAMNLWKRLELGIHIPAVAYQYAENYVSPSGDSRLNHPTQGGIAAPSAMLRYGMTSERAGAPLASAIAVEVVFPWTDKVDYGGEKGFIIAPRLELGKTLGGGLRLMADAGGQFRTEDVKLTNGDKLSHEVLGGLGVATTGKLRGELTARGAFNFDGLSQNVELLAGARYSFGEGEIYALGGPGFMESPGTPTYRGLIGFAFIGGKKKAAPPPPPPDPCAAGQAHTPEQCPALDDDGDGVANGQDRCPLEKGVAENQGCPDKDTDGDGVPDRLDRCPSVPGATDNQGCPKDSDKDGVTDDKDRCPDKPGIPENQGCPPERAEIKAGKIEIKEKVFFDTGKATIKPQSNALLDDVAKLIAANPQVGVVTVEGHTDSTGSAATNRALSQKRAEAVKDYLVSKGVDASRIEAKGFGPDQPVESNKTAKGREANRRVEFTIQNANP
jgi:outer membrane protein OmpA-like peptidoglycan-associated protein